MVAAKLAWWPPLLNSTQKCTSLASSGEHLRTHTCLACPLPPCIPSLHLENSLAYEHGNRRRRGGCTVTTWLGMSHSLSTGGGGGGSRHGGGEEAGLCLLLHAWHALPPLSGQRKGRDWRRAVTPPAHFNPTPAMKKNKLFFEGKKLYSGRDIGEEEGEPSLLSSLLSSSHSLCLTLL